MRIKNQKLILVFVGLLFSGVFFIPIKVPYTIDSIAKMLPANHWILSRGNGGEILKNTVNNISGIHNSYRLLTFERGESMILGLNPKMRSGDKVAQGDTLGVIYSSSRKEKLVQLQGELAVLNASLESAMSGAKNTEVQASMERLAVAVSERERQQKIVDRLYQLRKKNLVAVEEYQTAADQLTVLSKTVNVREAELASIRSGKKDEDIQLLRQQIAAVENELQFLTLEINTTNIIIAPFNGRIDRSFSDDTLLVISNIDSGMALIPVPLEQAEFIAEGGIVNFNAPNQNVQWTGIIQMKHPVMQFINGKQCVLVMATFNPAADPFIHGLLTQAEIDCGPVSLGTYLKRNIFN